MLFSRVCVCQHGGRGGGGLPHSLVPGLFPAIGPMSFLGGGCPSLWFQVSLQPLILCPLWERVPQSPVPGPFSASGPISFLVGYPCQSFGGGTPVSASGVPQSQAGGVAGQGSRAGTGVPFLAGTGWDTPWLGTEVPLPPWLGLGYPSPQRLVTLRAVCLLRPPAGRFSCLYLFLHTNLLTFDSFPYFNLSHFQSFLGAIIDTLLYQLHDSLARLANVRKLERSREDGKHCRTGNKYNQTCVNYKLNDILYWKCAS